MRFTDGGRDEPDRPLGQIGRRYWFEPRGNAKGQLSSRNPMVSGQTLRATAPAIHAPG